MCVNWKKMIGEILGAAFLAAFLAGNALAADQREKISSVTLNIESSIDTGDGGGDVMVTVPETAHYSVTETEVTNDNGNWKVGDQPRVEVTLEADSGYYFDAVGKSRLSLKGDKAEYSSYRRSNENTEIVFVIRLAKLDGNLELENVEWKDSSTPTATWDDENGASKYQVRLYRGSSGIGDAVTVSSRTYNFSAGITREGEYTFKVRAVGSSKKGEWYESEVLYISEDDVASIKKKAANLKNDKTSSGSGQKSSNSDSNGETVNGKDGIYTPVNANGAYGSWQHDGKGWWFRYPDGSYPKGGWLQVDGAWYCFDDAGYMRTGWVRASDGNYYYCSTQAGSTQGALLYNQKTPDGYWVNEKGAWVPGA